MNLFKNFFLLLWKNVLIVCIFIVIFSVLTIVLGSVYGSNSNEYFEESNYDICYIDEDESELSKGIIDYLSVSNRVVDVKGVSKTSIQDMLFFRIYGHELKFSEGFENKVLSGEDAYVDYSAGLPSGAQGYVIKNQVDDYIVTYKTLVNSGFTEAQAVEKTKSMLIDHVQVTIAVEDSVSAPNENSTIFVGNQYLWFSMFSGICFAAGVVILSGMEDNLSSRIDASPVSRSKRNLVNAASITILGLGLYLIFVIVEAVVGHGSSNWKEYWWIYLINGLLATLTVTALTSLITSFRIKASNINMIANLFGVSLAFLGGEFVPQNIMGDNVLKISRFVPTYWYVYVNNMTHSFGATEFALSEVYKGFAIQILFIAVFWVGAAAVGRIRTDLRE